MNRAQAKLLAVMVLPFAVRFAYCNPDYAFWVAGWLTGTALMFKFFWLNTVEEDEQKEREEEVSQ